MIDHPPRQHFLAQAAARVNCYCCGVLDCAVAAVALQTRTVVEVARRNGLLDGIWQWREGQYKQQE